VGALALTSEEADDLDGRGVGAGEPVRHPGLELCRLAGGQHEVLATEHQPEPSVEDVDPLVPPAPEQFDLVSAQFMHLPRPSLDLLHLRLAAAVRPGGTLLVVGHHPSELDTTVVRWDLPDLLFTAEQVAAVLDPDDWSRISATSPERQESDPDGRPLRIHDAVLHAVRRR